MKPIYSPSDDKPMNIAFFSSKGPGNFQTALNTAEKYSSLMNIRLLVTDNTDNPSIELAKSKGLPIIAKDFRAALKDIGPSTDKSRYLSVREQLHNEIHQDMERLQHQESFSIDLLVLAYRRIITGQLLDRYKDRIINQHPADLSVRSNQGKRKYIGISGLSQSIIDGVHATRTSTILVNEDIDDGEVICQGPEVSVSLSSSSTSSINAHEQLQKCMSDPPSLAFALLNIANGKLKVSEQTHENSHSRIIYFEKSALPYAGKQL